jgi:hypothetical protein
VVSPERVASPEPGDDDVLKEGIQGEGATCCMVPRGLENQV